MTKEDVVLLILCFSVAGLAYGAINFVQTKIADHGCAIYAPDTGEFQWRER